MAFTVVPTKISGDVWTEAMWDASLKDNLNAGVMRTLGNVVLSEDATSVIFTGISASTHAHLMLDAAMRASGTVAVEVFMAFNTDTGNNYDHQLISAFATTVSGGESIGVGPSIGFAVAGDLAVAGLYAGFEIWIPAYAGTGQKTYHSSCSHKQSTTSTDVLMFNRAGFWRNASAVDSVMLYGGTFVAGSQFTLYGVGGTA